MSAYIFPSVRPWRLGVLLLAVALWTSAAWAGELYYYVDEDGVYHFSDQRRDAKFNKLMVWKEGDYEAQTIELDDRYREIIYRASRIYDVEEPLIMAMVKVESNFRPDAISPKGAQGLMQLMPETARRYRVDNSFNPRDNIYAGALHMKTLLIKYQGDVELALAAYNAGPGAVEKYKGIPPYKETQNYVRLVLNYRELYREQIKTANTLSSSASSASKSSP